MTPSQDDSPDAGTQARSNSVFRSGPPAAHVSDTVAASMAGGGRWPRVRKLLREILFWEITLSPRAFINNTKASEAVGLRNILLPSTAFYVEADSQRQTKGKKRLTMCNRAAPACCSDETVSTPSSTENACVASRGCLSISPSYAPEDTHASTSDRHTRGQGQAAAME